MNNDDREYRRAGRAGYIGAVDEESARNLCATGALLAGGAAYFWANRQMGIKDPRLVTVVAVIAFIIGGFIGYRFAKVIRALLGIGAVILIGGIVYSAAQRENKAGEPHLRDLSALEFSIKKSLKEVTGKDPYELKLEIGDKTSYYGSVKLGDWAPCRIRVNVDQSIATWALLEEDTTGDSRPTGTQIRGDWTGRVMIDTEKNAGSNGEGK